MAKILIVDDEVQLIQMLQMRLEASGYEIVTAANGEEGIEQAKKEKPDLIILDIMMPVMDGHKACEILKRNEETSSIPILILSAKAQEEDLNIGKYQGADAFVKKPFETSHLLEKIEKLLS